MGNIYENINHYIYDSDSGPGRQLYSQSSPGDLAAVEVQRNGKFSQNGKLGLSCVRVTKSRLYEPWVRDRVIVHLGLKMSAASPIIVGVRSMVVTLWQQFE